MRTLTFQRVTFTMGLPLLKRAIQDQVEKTRKFVSRSLVIGEVLSTADMATGVKCGIIYWLFGGAVRNLGGPAHVTQWLQPLQEQKYTGMFAMTERGHGSNVRGIQTEATFDFSAQEFVINTPCKDAEKMYIGNAMYGNYAAVFAQLIIHGRSQGPHCFIVPVRDEHGRLHPGVTAVDMMHKEGLHGVDNGILRFDSVRIPRENLLDKFGSVAPDGQYHSPIKDKSARFNAMLAALTPSRLAVTFQAMGSMKLGLTIAVRYSHSRRQFGPKAREEVKIIEHQTQTLRLMPHLATALALTFASRYAGTLLDEDIFRGKELVSSRPLQALVAGLKAYSTWENVSCLQDCRECTGGMVVVRELLAQYTKQYEERPVSSLLRNWVESGSDRLRTSFLAFNTDTVGNLTFLLKAVHFRERILQRSLVARIYYKCDDAPSVTWARTRPPSPTRSAVSAPLSSFELASVETGMEEAGKNPALGTSTRVTLTGSKVRETAEDRVGSVPLECINQGKMRHVTSVVTLEQFCLAVRNCPDQEDQTLLKKFCLLYGTKLVFQERAWYLEHKYLTPMTSMRIRRQLLHLCDSVKDDALRVISAFNISHAFLHAPIAGLANPKAAWVLYPAPQHSLAGERARSPRPKLGAKL
ncbi:acyl-coenzyme A oxidase-like protein [Muntiacus reevesi]|uniref:acyl-coenzyme A oxidase-like protein n=1 Tax=Muntiacus reevesi TaxID=9886 RepID=UPI00330728CD